MIKECKVLLNNDAVTVVRFDNKEVQLPPIGHKADVVTVRCENGKYEVVKEKVVIHNESQPEESAEKEQPKVKRQPKKKPVEAEE